MARRALIIDPGGARGSLAAARALGGAGWAVGVGAPGARSHAGASRFARWREDVPHPRRDPAQFVRAVADAVAARGYDTVFGCGDADVLALSLHRDQIGAANAYPPHDVVRRSLDKLTLAQAATASGLASPHTVAGDEAGLAAAASPIVVKPRLHAAPAAAEERMRVEARIAPDRETAKRFAAEIRAVGGEPLLQELVRGRLTAVTLLADRDSRVVSLLGQVAERTWPPGAGVSARARTIAVPAALAEAIERLIESLGWFGLAQLQFLVGADETPRLIDFNGRFYGSLALAVAAGPNLPAAWAALAVGDPLPPLPEARPGVRYQWLEGDLRRAVAERRGGLLTDLAQTLARAPGAAHSVFRLDDPLPAASYAAMRARRAIGRARGR